MFTVLLSGAAEVPSALLTHFLAYLIVAAASILFLTCSLRSLYSTWGGSGVDRWFLLALASCGALGYAAFGVVHELVAESASHVVGVYKHGSLLVFVAFLAFA